MGSVKDFDKSYTKFALPSSARRTHERVRIHKVRFLPDGGLISNNNKKMFCNVTRFTMLLKKTACIIYHNMFDIAVKSGLFGCSSHK